MHTSYRIYSINRPGGLLNFGTMRMGAYSRVGAYNFLSIFSKRGQFESYHKQAINNSSLTTISKTNIGTQLTLLLLRPGLVQKCFFIGRGWGGRLFEGGRL